MVPAYEIWFYCIEHVKGNNFENIQVFGFLDSMMILFHHCEFMFLF